MPAPWLKALKVAFTWFAVAAMVLAVWRSWHFLANAWAGAAPGNLIAAVLLWAATHFVAPGVAVLVLGRDRAVDYRAALGVHALRLPAKYIPGGIWHMVGRVADFRELGHERPSLVDFVLIENLVAAGCALGVGASLLLLFGGTPLGYGTGGDFAPGMSWARRSVPWGLRLVTRSGRVSSPPTATWTAGADRGLLGCWRRRRSSYSCERFGGHVAAGERACAVWDVPLFVGCRLRGVFRARKE